MSNWEDDMSGSISTYPFSLRSYELSNRSPEEVLDDMIKFCDEFKLKEERELRRKTFKTIIEEIMKYCNFDGQVYIRFSDEDMPK